MAWEYVVAVVLLGAAFVVLDRLMAMARRRGMSDRERLALLTLAILAGPLGWWIIWWLLDRTPAPTAVASG